MSENGNPSGFRKVAEADFPTRFGHFRIYSFDGTYHGEVEEALALRMGDIFTPEPVLVRVHSQCMTGDIFHSLRCDCRAQLELSISQIVDERRGLLIYEHQEGRGIGLANKIRAYELQDNGADTVEANLMLGFKADHRDYGLPVDILKYFNVKAVRLLSNNPDKINALENGGVRVAERVPCIVEPVMSSETYLRTKKEKLGHLLDL